MSLKAILFDFNGVIINDEPLHERLVEQLLIEENLRPKAGEFREFCLGRSDRACLRDLLTHRGRVVTDDYLETLIARKSRAYVEQLGAIEKLPLYVGLEDLLFKLKGTACKLAIVSGAVRAEVELVLDRAQLRHYFSVIISGDDIATSKPELDGYLSAIARLNTEFPDLQLQPSQCLAIEDTFAGIDAAKRAGIPVLGVANTYPFHMLQRRANWTVDYLSDLELDRVQQIYEKVAIA
ncbi:MAG: HAD family phosphatase [Myxacorys chilensis ATA2-1-KO14]|jgi:HAD superfamily hydrolase (TIGR01509 family)|nr:HAD family phosphatase [Myxacorys chilensis ATA2-1-KO14]